MPAIPMGERIATVMPPGVPLTELNILPGTPVVDRRRAMSRGEFLTLYALARIVPAGTMSGMAVAIGYRFGGLLGTLAALAGVALPGLLPTLALVVLYDALRGSSAFELLCGSGTSSPAPVQPHRARFGCLASAGSAP